MERGILQRQKIELVLDGNLVHEAAAFGLVNVLTAPSRSGNICLREWFTPGQRRQAAELRLMRLRRDESWQILLIVIGCAATSRPTSEA